MVALQQSAGNASVSAMLARRKKSKGPAHQEDSAEALKKASIDDLIDLFLIPDDLDIRFLSESVSFSRDWIRGEGDEHLRAAIEQRMAAMNRTELPGLLDKIRAREGSVLRKFWLRMKADARLQYSKDDFLRLTNEVNTHIDLADRKTRAWLASLATSYRRAWKAHKDVLAAQDEQNLFKEKLKMLPLQIVLGAGLAFVPGGVGGVVGARLKAAQSTEFMVDGLKDLTKWSLRSTGQAGIEGGIKFAETEPALKAYPLDPDDWEGKETERVTTELAVATRTLLDWQSKARTDDPSLPLNFNPIEVMDNALTVSDDTGRRHKATELEPVSHDETATQFEQGFWTKWLELYGYQLELWRDWGWGNKEYVMERNVGPIVEQHCKKLGLDVEQYAQLAKARIDAQFPGDKHQGDFYFESDD